MNKINFFIINFEKINIQRIKCPLICECECKIKDKIYCCTEKYVKCIEYQALTYGFSNKKILRGNIHVANSLTNKVVVENNLKKLEEGD